MHAMYIKHLRPGANHAAFGTIACIVAPATNASDVTSAACHHCKGRNRHVMRATRSRIISTFLPAIWFQTCNFNRIRIRSLLHDCWAPCNLAKHNSASFTCCFKCKTFQIFIAWFALLFSWTHSSCLQCDVSAALAACTFHTKAAWFAPGLREMA